MRKKKLRTKIYNAKKICYTNTYKISELNPMVMHASSNKIHFFPML